MHNFASKSEEMALHTSFVRKLCQPAMPPPANPANTVQLLETQASLVVSRISKTRNKTLSLKCDRMASRGTKLNDPDHFNECSTQRISATL